MSIKERFNMSKRRGRPEINNITINRKLFDSALLYKQITLSELSSLPEIDVSEKTIQRIRKEQLTNATMLNKIAKCLNVDPLWLTGECLKLAPALWENDDYINPANHPYNQLREDCKHINSSTVLHELLLLHSISNEQYNLLPSEKQNGLELELDLAIQMVIFKYFHPVALKNDPFLSNEELYRLSCEVLSSSAYDELLSLIVLH